MHELTIKKKKKELIMEENGTIFRQIQRNICRRNSYGIVIGSLEMLVTASSNLLYNNP